MSAELDRRVKARFALGASETQIMSELEHEGFTPGVWVTPPDKERRAVRREDNMVCRQAAYVFWRADNDGNLTAVRGAYREEGCL